MKARASFSVLSEETQHQKVAIYIRVSTHWQIDKDSLQIQRRELIVYAEIMLGITFVSKNEQFDTSTAIGEAMLKIILVFAELERQMAAERVTAVMISRTNNGQWIGGRVPYGYDYDAGSKAFSINPMERRVYERIVELYEKKQSVIAVAKYLNEHGISTRAGGEWSTVAAHKCLKNPWYTKYISKVDPAAPRAFIRSVAKEIVVTDGEVESIAFQSGVKCIFSR